VVTLRLLVLLVFCNIFAQDLDTVININDENYYSSIFYKFFDLTRNNTYKLIDNTVSYLFSSSGTCKYSKILDLSIFLGALYVLIIGFVLVLVLNYLSKIFQYQIFSLTDELGVMISSGILMVFIFVVYNFYVQNNIYENARTYIINVLFSVFMHNLYLSFLSDALVKFSALSLPTGDINASFRVRINLEDYLSSIFKLIAILQNYIQLIIGEYIFKLFVLCLSGEIFIKILLPISFILRAFVLTRPIGNALVGLILGFVVVYPFILYVLYKFYQSIGIIWDDIVYGSFITGGLAGLWFFLAYVIKLGVKSFLRTFIDKFSKSSIGKIINYGSQVMEIGYNYATILALFNSIYYIIFSIAVFGTMVGIVLGPLSIFLVVTISNNIAKSIGANLNLAAFSRLI
jgi:hypothetical protein